MSANLSQSQLSFKGFNNPKKWTLKKTNPKTPLPWWEGIKGRGIRMVIMHPHPSPLPSRERGNWMESMSILGTI
jgi:hypothetical protein